MQHVQPAAAPEVILLDIKLSERIQEVVNGVSPLSPDIARLVLQAFQTPVAGRQSAAIKPKPLLQDE
jgi:hypothetical protein